MYSAIQRAESWATVLIEAAHNSLPTAGETTIHQLAKSILTGLFANEAAGVSCFRPLDGSHRKQKGALNYTQQHVDDVIALLVDSGLVEEIRDRKSTQNTMGFETPVVVLRAKEQAVFYLRRYYRAERAIADYLVYQKHAAATSLSDSAKQNHFVLLTGGPGSGKTSQIAALFDAAQWRDKKCLLTAPTARAAQRLHDSLVRRKVQNLPPHMTLHRALGAAHGAYRYNAQQKLDVDLVVVDEASMVEVQMLAALLDAMPDHATLIMAGDPDQLPAVGVGSMLSDLCKSFADSERFAPLAKIERYDQNGPIGLWADAIKNRDFAGVRRLGNSSNEKEYVCYERVDKKNFKRTVHAWLKQYGSNMVPNLPLDDVSKTLDPKIFADAMNKQRVLCAISQGPQGVSAVNDLIRQYLRHAPDDNGLPWMIRRNDHNRGLYNGHIAYRVPQGYCVPEVATDSGSGNVFSSLPDSELSLATTIHKSQGSEYSHVLVILPEKTEKGQLGELLTWELLYTAVTRVFTQKGTLPGGVTLIEVCEDDSSERSIICELLDKESVQKTGLPELISWLKEE